MLLRQYMIRLQRRHLSGSWCVSPVNATSPLLLTYRTLYGWLKQFPLFHLSRAVPSSAASELVLNARSALNVVDAQDLATQIM